MNSNIVLKHDKFIIIILYINTSLQQHVAVKFLVCDISMKSDVH